MESRRKKVAGIGELLWDLLPQGKQLGGAPCNFAFHALQAGCEAHMISAIGTDRDGEEILEVLAQLGLDTSFIQRSPGSPTGTVSVKLDRNGVPDYTIHENVAWDHIGWNDSLEVLAGELDTVCFGSLAQRDPVSRETIHRFVASTNETCLRVFDINLRQTFYHKNDLIRSLEMASVLKLNEDELPVLCGLLGWEGSEDRLLNRLLHAFGLRLVAFTRGGRGSVLISPGETSVREVPDVEICDTVGAGDSFTAFLVAGMLRGLPIARIHSLATEVATYVCTRSGATPRLPEYFINQLKK